MIDARALDEALVERYSRSFFGFGSAAAPYWLITAEPLDQRSPLPRIEGWRRLGEPPLADAPSLAAACEITAETMLGAGAGSSLPLLLRILLDALGEPCAPFDVSEYLRTRAGHGDDRLALAHLFALPLRRAERWEGHEIGGSLALRTRTAYLEAFAQGRIEALGRLIAAAAPRLVLMVGNVYGSYWERLAGAPLTVEAEVPLRRLHRGATLFVQIAQPDVAGSLNATYSAALAAYVRERILDARVGGVRGGRGE